MSPSHVVLSCKANWSMSALGAKSISVLMYQSGHLRSMCILSARIAHSRAVSVTILVASSGNVVDRVTQEVSRCSDIEELDKSSKVRCVISECSGSKSLFFIVALDLHWLRVVGLPSDGRNGGSLDDPFKLVWKALINSEPVTCSHTCDEVEAVPKPSVVILDVGSSTSSRAYSATNRSS
jgi:hypothetical protein